MKTLKYSAASDLQWVAERARVVFVLNHLFFVGLPLCTYSGLRPLILSDMQSLHVHLGGVRAEFLPVGGSLILADVLHRSVTNLMPCLCSRYRAYFICCSERVPGAGFCADNVCGPAVSLYLAKLHYVWLCLGGDLRLSWTKGIPKCILYVHCQQVVGHN